MHHGVIEHIFIRAHNIWFQSQTAVTRVIKCNSSGVVASNEQVAAEVELVTRLLQQQGAFNVFLHDALQGRCLDAGVAMADLLQHSHTRYDLYAPATVIAGWLVDPNACPRFTSLCLSSLRIF